MVPFHRFIVFSRSVVLVVTLVVGLSLLSACDSTSQTQKGTDNSEQNSNVETDSSSQGSDYPVSTERAIKFAMRDMEPNSAASYGYEYGELRPIMADSGSERLVPDFSISGMILTGEDHDKIDVLLSGGYRTSDVQGMFNLGEEIGFYFDDDTVALLDDDTKIIVVPHQEVAIYSHMPVRQMEEIANLTGGFVIDATPESVKRENGANFVGSGSISKDDGKEGLYDVLFCKGDEAAQYMVLRLKWRMKSGKTVEGMCSLHRF